MTDRRGNPGLVVPLDQEKPSPHVPHDSSTSRESGGLFRSAVLKSMWSFVASLVEATRWHLLAAILLMTLTSLTEGFGVALLFPVLEVAGFNMTNQGHVGHYTAEVQNLLRYSGLRPSLWLATLLMAFMLVMALRSLFNRAQSVGTLDTVLRYEMDLSRRLYQAILDADWLFLVRTRSSDFTHVLTAELGRVSAAANWFIGMLSNAILAVVYVALALKLSAGTTLIVLAAGGVLLLVAGRWMRAVHESGVAMSDAMRAVYSAASEHMQNLKAIKTYGAQAADLQIFTSLEASALNQNLRSIGNQAAGAFWFEAGSLVVLAGVIFVSLHILRVGPASILLLLAIFTRLMPRLAAASNQLQSLLADLPAFENLTRIYQECREHAEVAGPREIVPELAREIRLEDISFEYEAGRSVLDGLSLTIAAGSLTALVGSSGSGKSTVADLVNGLLLPRGGRILLDGVELTPALTQAWRRRIGYVAPDTGLFHDTVRVNLLWAQPDASEEDLREALRLAAAEFVFELPLGLDTTVGDRGVLLSNGQRQRIALARALLRKPSLLILDEATNSLDVENERRILDAIEKLKGHTTILLIAHRASAIQRSDTIYVLENGRIAEFGNWETLSGHASTRAQSIFRLQDAPA